MPTPVTIGIIAHSVNELHSRGVTAEKARFSYSTMKIPDGLKVLVHIHFQN